MQIAGRGNGDKEREVQSEGEEIFSCSEPLLVIRLCPAASSYESKELMWNEWVGSVVLPVD